MKYNIQPIADRVFIKLHPPKTTTAGGIELPEGSQEYQRLGVVVAVGPGQLRVFPKPITIQPMLARSLPVGTVVDVPPVDRNDYFPMKCKEGDLVVVPHHAEKIALDSSKPDEFLAICTESQLLAILTENTGE